MYIYFYPFTFPILFRMKKKKRTFLTISALPGKRPTLYNCSCMTKYKNNQRINTCMITDNDQLTYKTSVLDYICTTMCKASSCPPTNE
jgi:hypothetical protein